MDSGNTNDDTTHRTTWDLLAQLVGSPDFLYVADCKLASRENLRHIASRGGRFITVLPASRREDQAFRNRLRAAEGAVAWSPGWNREDDSRVQDDDQPLPVVDVIRAAEQEQVSSDGFRLIWFHSRRKAELDEAARAQRLQRAIQELEELQRRALGEAAAKDGGQSPEDQGAIAIYPEGRRTPRPTARRVLDALEPLRRHEIHRNVRGAASDPEPQHLFDDLNETQTRLLKLLRIDPETYGR